MIVYRAGHPDSGSFDELYKDVWVRKYKQDPSSFRYKVEGLLERTLPGKYNFLMQLNLGRVFNRRAPAVISSLKQPVDPNQFNFSKISENEIMFKVLFEDDYSKQSDAAEDIILINTSPICFGHGMFCPQMRDVLPQIITEDSLLKVIRLMLLNKDVNLRMGFNSLCAMASVNHLHYHCLIVNHRLPVENCECEHSVGPLYVTKNYPAKGFCFQVFHQDDINKICSEIFKLITFCMDNDIAHNLFVTHGQSFDSPDRPALRVFIWLRSNCYGAKQPSAFNLAICELSGQILIKNQKDYDELTEVEIENCLDDCASETFQENVSNVMKIYSK